MFTQLFFSMFTWFIHWEWYENTKSFPFGGSIIAQMNSWKVGSLMFLLVFLCLLIFLDNFINHECLYWVLFVPCGFTVLAQDFHPRIFCILFYHPRIWVIFWGGLCFEIFVLVIQGFYCVFIDGLEWCFGDWIFVWISEFYWCICYWAWWW